MDGDKLQVDGFSFGAVKSGIRGKDRLDLALIYCEQPAVAAAVYTTSQVKAAPVVLGQQRIASGRAQAVLINSGVANACTGTKGMENAVACSAILAETLDIPDDLVHVSSTGVIGEQLDMACFQRHISALAALKSIDGLMDVAHAIMTTDTVPKTAVKSIAIDGITVKLVGIAKGAGMIMPNMATMLGFVMTDANIAPDVLSRFVKSAADDSFNRITVDGDTSTNDTVLVLASGMAQNKLLADAGAASAMLFKAALDELTRDLALQIVADGEGASKLVTIKLVGAVDAAQAEMAARTIANSCLVKTAFFGQDANWGRIIAALGRSGAEFSDQKVHIAFDDCFLVQNGLWTGAENEAAATKVLQQDSFMVSIDLQNGNGEYEIFTCDLSLDYVRINADYRT